MWTLGFFASILPLLATASPLPSSDLAARNQDHHYKVDPKCPAGTTPGFEVYTARYDVPAKEFYAKVGSFFDEVWYVSIISSLSLSYLIISVIADSVALRL